MREKAQTMYQQYEVTWFFSGSNNIVRKYKQNN